MKTRPHEFVFPVVLNGPLGQKINHPGISLRDVFAAVAMLRGEATAKDCYEKAQEMLDERDRLLKEEE